MENIFEIQDERINLQEIMKKIDQRIEEKKKAGLYRTYNLDRINMLEVEKISDDRAFLDYYLKVIRRTCDIDIGDFAIHSKGGWLGQPIVWFKKLIWHCLKFYTYRLFSQQKEFNAQITNDVISLNQKVDKSLAGIKRQSQEK